jgi:hypothetical protein
MPSSSAARSNSGLAAFVVDILVAGEPREYRLPKLPAQPVARVPAASALEKLRDRDLGKAFGIVKFSMSEQPAVRRDPGALEFGLYPAVEIDPRPVSPFKLLIRLAKRANGVTRF